MRAGKAGNMRAGEGRDVTLNTGVEGKGTKVRCRKVRPGKAI